MQPEDTGISFSNSVSQTPDFNIINYLYFYDGGGVSIGDVNNDGLPDIYLTANMGANKLYLNEGSFKFTDITEKAGVAGKGDWTTGTTMADVNGDGLLDIYVSNVSYRSKEGRNQLFINNGDSTFSERAAEYGLDFSGYSKQASFFDMDSDGDLDMYLLNHAVHTKDSFQPSDRRSITSDNAGDRLYRNDGGKFTEVTEEAGIYNSVLGYGLGVTISDLNGDHYPDIYVSNDFHENDYLYVNQGDGTFNEVLEKSTQHTSRASMGNDINDINNDLKPDIAVLDMLPATEKGQKTAVSSEPYEVYSIQREYGYHPQFIRNTLQLNLGESDSVPAFAEIAPLAGVHATDWSWSALLFDMDNDGLKDLFVSNGIYRRPNDLDYLSMVRTDEVQKSLDRGITADNISVIDSMPHVKIPNVAFSNDGDLSFSDKTDKWGLASPSYSSGMAYGDLDNDGDLDLVINNVNSNASVYRNRTTEQDSSSFLTVKLESQNNNTWAVGSKVIAYTDEQRQLAQLTMTRGFQSSVEPRIFFGFDEASRVDSLKIIWPDGKETIKADISVNQHLVINRDESNPVDSAVKKEGENHQRLSEVQNPLQAKFKHDENNFDEFKSQSLMPYQLYKMGPAVAGGEVNNNGLDDFYIGGARKQSGSLYIQQENGKFKRQPNKSFENDSLYEDTDAVFFDANNDGALDLYVVSGGNEKNSNVVNFEDRLYLNDGDGKFIHSQNAIPDLEANGSVVVPFDYDDDDNMDLFVGSRSIPENYGITPSSSLLKNQGDGTFVDVTKEQAPDLQEIGMVSDAATTDINGDGHQDLIVAGDWMPLTAFVNRNDMLQKFDALETSSGLWQSVHISDVDNDGDPDILAGNMGLNTTLNASDDEPLVMYLNDFDQDGNYDPIIGQTQGDTIYPIAPRDHLLEPFYYLRSKFPTYESYAGKSISEIFGEERMEGATMKEVTSLASVFIENKGDGEFEVHKLPRHAQFAPIFDFHTRANKNGFKDVIMGGNLHDVQPLYGGQYDASYGWYLEGNKDGQFTVLAPEKSGLYIEGEIRDFAAVKQADGNELIIVGINNKEPVFLE